MDLSRLRNKFLKARSNEDKRAYNTQRCYCLTLVRKAAKDCNNLVHKSVTGDNTFKKSIKPLLTKKNSTNNKITLVEQDSLLNKNGNVAEVLNNV